MRPSWDDYFLSLAEAASTRATCDRLHVGCVLVRNNRQLVTGYNGSLPGDAHCDDVGHILDANGSCIATMHAEQNAIAQAAELGVSVAGATAYLTDSPCRLCARLLFAAGVRRVVFEHRYRITAHFAPLEALGMVFVHHKRTRPEGSPEPRAFPSRQR